MHDVIPSKTEVLEDAEVSKPFEQSGHFAEMLRTGYSLARLDEDTAQRLAHVYAHAADFFAQSDEAKLRHGIESRNVGYRPFAYAGTPNGERDFNDSFVYWAKERNALPHSEEIFLFLQSLEMYRTALMHLVEGIINEMSSHYSYQHELPFARASLLQVNSYFQLSDRELLQARHEDATFLTVISVNAEGLEVELEGEMKGITLKPGEVLLMPGSIMALMTSGDVQPLYHRARNFHHVHRKSVMYFVSPDVNSKIEPFVANNSECIRNAVVDAPQLFGLADDFVNL